MALTRRISTVAVAAVVAAAAVSLTPTAQAAAPHGTGQSDVFEALTIGKTLTAGQVVESANNTLGLGLVMQADGNLVEYVTTSGRVVFQTRTHGAGNRLVFQADHNIVLYSKTGKALWQTRTYGTGAQALVLAGNGQLIAADSKLTHVYYESAGKVAPVGSTVIAGLSSPNQNYAAVLQDDGNFVVYYAANGSKPHALWQSRTNGHPRSMLVLQADGNLVVSDHSGRPIWSTGTAGHPTGRLLMQSDGNLVLYSGKTALWSTHTNGKK